MALIECPECGRKVSDRAISCPNCAFPIATELASAPMTAVYGGDSPQFTKVDRDITIAHLSDLLALELIKEKCNREIMRVCDFYKINPMYDNLDNLIRELGSRSIYAVVPLCRDDNYSTRLDHKSDAELLREAYKKKVPFLDMNFEIDGKKYDLVTYTKIKKKIPDNLHLKITESVCRGFPRIKTMFNNLDAIAPVLKKAYRPNLIPVQFRNLYAIYFLYNYMSTSQESLSNAFLHLDLNTIKKKIDKLIKLHEESVIQQAITNAKLTEIQTSFSEMIELATAISRETEKIAQYMEISTAHLETIKYLQFVR